MYLLDTHAMLWYLRDSSELSVSAHSLIDKAEYVAVSIASFWEIAIKQSIGKMQFCMTIPEGRMRPPPSQDRPKIGPSLTQNRPKVYLESALENMAYSQIAQ